MLTKVFGSAIVVIIPLVAAQWLIPPEVPFLPRQALLCAWAVGAILAAERLFFSRTVAAATRAVGFLPPHGSTVIIASLACAPMWVFLPLFAWFQEVAAPLRPDWPVVLLGVVLVNGIAEEVIHRGFVFGHLRREHAFATAATLPALLFAAQHLYIIATMGWTIGVASVLLALLLAYPLAVAFERSGHSLAVPAILHTSSNAPVLVLALPEEFLATALLPHMAVILASLYAMWFVVRRVPVSQTTSRALTSRAR